MITRFIILLILTFGVTMIGGPIFINSDSVYGANSKSTVKGGLVGIQNDQNGSPITKSNSTMFNGTATLTMKNGPVTDVPISIKLMNGHAISIWLDPLKT